MLLTGPQAARLVGVDPATIRQWKRRGALEPAGLDERGRPMYAQDDVARAELATRHRAGRSVTVLAAAAPTSRAAYRPAAAARIPAAA